MSTKERGLQQPKLSRYLRCGAVLFLFIITPSSVMAYQSDWIIDSNASKVQFVTRTETHIRAIGTFTKIAGKLVCDQTELTKSKISAQIPIASIQTGMSVRDEHLKSKKYFDVDQFPTALFSSQRIVKTGKSSYLLHGQLTLHGVSKAIDVVIDTPQFQTNKAGNQVMNAIGTATVDQKDFGLSLLKLHPDGAVWINKAIAIQINIRATRQEASSQTHITSKTKTKE